MSRDREYAYALLAVRWDYHSGHSCSQQFRRTGSRRSRVPAAHLPLALAAQNSSDAVGLTSILDRGQ